MNRLASVFLILCAGAWSAESVTPNVTARTEIDSFNQALTEATRHMDNAAIVALWDDGGVSLLPSTKPIVGKKAIAKFMEDVTTQLPSGRMEKFDMRCFDIETSGNWASEWCQEHQIVVFTDGKPTFEGRGNMLLVLHRGVDGKWRLQREMWNQALVPNPSSSSE